MGSSEGGDTGDTRRPDDALRRLEERLDRASDAAERLFAQAREASRTEPPPSGWQTPAPEAEATETRDLELLAPLFAALRELIPPDLQRRLAEALRELLLALRALIDWYLERTERRRPKSADVQDIPIL